MNDRLECAVNVAFSSLTHHFVFDHPEVSILSVEPNKKTTLIVSFSDLPCDSSLCVALLASNKLRYESTNQYYSFENKYNKFNLIKKTKTSSGTTARLFNGNHIHPNYRDRLPLQNDVIISWIAGLDLASVGLIFCSIQVHQKFNIFHIFYHQLFMNNLFIFYLPTKKYFIQLL